MPQIPQEELSQVAALPFRIKDGKIEVLLVTSRETKRWLIPKGWPMKGKKPHKAAAQEAEEEAGVKGEIKNKPLGSYDYWKRRAAHFDLCRVNVYPLEVSKQLKILAGEGAAQGAVVRGRGSRPPGSRAGAGRPDPQPARSTSDGSAATE